MSNKIKLFQTAKEIYDRGDIRLSSSDRIRIENETKELIRKSITSRKAAKAPEGFEGVLEDLKNAKDPDEAYTVVVDFLRDKGEIEELERKPVKTDDDDKEDKEDDKEDKDDKDHEMKETPDEEKKENEPKSKAKDDNKDKEDKPKAKEDKGFGKDKMEDKMEGKKPFMGPGKEGPKDFEKDKESLLKAAQELEEDESTPMKKRLMQRDKKDRKQVSEAEMGVDSAPMEPLQAAAKYKVRITPDKNIVATCVGKGPLFCAVPSDDIKKDASALRRTANKVLGLVIYEGPAKAASKCGARLIGGIDSDVVLDSDAEIPKDDESVLDNDVTDNREERTQESDTVLEDMDTDAEEKPETVKARLKISNTYKVWEDGGDVIEVEAKGMNEALDLAAKDFGYVDYADMAREKNWDPDDEGLNIKVAKKSVKARLKARIGRVRKARLDRRYADTILDDAEDLTDAIDRVNPSSLSVIKDDEEDTRETRKAPPSDALVDVETDFAKVEANFKSLYAAKAKRTAAKQLEEFVDKFGRCLKIASRRMELNYDSNPLKASIMDALTVSIPLEDGDEVVPLEPHVAKEVTEAICKEGQNQFVDYLLSRTADLMEKSAEYLKDLESDISNLNVVDLNVPKRAKKVASRRNPSMRRAASEGNFSFPVSAPVAVNPVNALRDAIGDTKVARKNAGLKRFSSR